MNPRRTTLTAALSTAAAAAVCAALAGCSGQAGATPAPSTTTGPAATTSSGASATPSASTSTSLDAAAQETKDRQDAEIAWRKVDTLFRTIQAMPADQVNAAASALTVDPLLSRLLAQNTQFRAEGKVGYGTNIIYVSWPKPINGADTALFDDCQDGSQAGYQDAKTGQKLTVGTVNTPIQVTVKRTEQGWKVAQADLVTGGTCTPGKAW